MNRIKLFAVSFVLCLTGVVYAAGDDAKRGAKSCQMDKAGASCCAPGAACCGDGGGSCCAAHKSDHKHTNAQASKTDKKESCCQPGASCCQPGASCCAAAHKSDHKQTFVGHASTTHEDGASCCTDGAECCKGGSCCTKDKQKDKQ